MHRSIVIAIASFFLVCAASAYAGEVVGSAQNDKTIVWLEGSLPSAQPAARRTISQRGIRFSPDFSVIVAGTSVEMPNDDNVAHNVYSLSPVKRFNLGVYAKGESRTVVFDKPGVVGLKCWLHQRMIATVVVVPNRFYAVTENGGYRIANVPAGTYKIVALEIGKEKVIRNITVPTNGTARLDL